jgi:hypothetical protein
VAPSTHKQALSALLFLYRDVLEVDLPWMNDILRPKDRVRVPTVLSVGEVARLFAALEGPMALLGRLIYGTGLRLVGARPFDLVARPGAQLAGGIYAGCTGSEISKRRDAMGVVLGVASSRIVD